jgi:hypothetical protein
MIIYCRSPIYAPRFVQVLVFMDEFFHEQVFASEIHAVENVNHLYYIEFSNLFVYGRYVRLRMIGKWGRQDMDQLYYTCLSRVRIFGLYFDEVKKSHPLLFNAMSQCVIPGMQIEDRNDDFQPILSEILLLYENEENLVQFFNLNLQNLLSKDAKFWDAIMAHIVHLSLPFERSKLELYLKSLLQFKIDHDMEALTQLEIYIGCKKI